MASRFTGNQKEIIRRLCIPQILHCSDHHVVELNTTSTQSINNNVIMKNNNNNNNIRKWKCRFLYAGSWAEFRIWGDKTTSVAEELETIEQCGWWNKTGRPTEEANYVLIMKGMVQRETGGIPGTAKASTLFSLCHLLSWQKTDSRFLWLDSVSLFSEVCRGFLGLFIHLPFKL